MVKPNIGGSGAGITCFDTPADLERAVREDRLDLGPDNTALVQEVITSPDGSITRVELLDGEPLYAIRITPPAGHGFNLCPADICQEEVDLPPETAAGQPLGSFCPTKPAMEIERADVPDSVRDTVTAIARAAGLDVCGIEYIVDERDGQPYVYDVNALSTSSPTPTASSASTRSCRSWTSSRNAGRPQESRSLWRRRPLLARRENPSDHRRVREPLRIDVDGGSVSAIAYEPADAAQQSLTLILAHGAGAGQTHPFIVDYAQAFAVRGIETITFNFPYMERGRRLPDRAPVLEACYGAVIDEVRRRAGRERPGLVIGGKSMGGRIATQLAAQDEARAVSARRHRLSGLPAAFARPARTAPDGTSPADPLPAPHRPGIARWVRDPRGASANRRGPAERRVARRGRRRSFVQGSKAVGTAAGHGACSGAGRGREVDGCAIW